MRKLVILCLSVLLVVAISGCTGNSGTPATTSSDGLGVLVGGTSRDTGPDANAKIDVDLTTLNDVLRLAELNNMLGQPAKYAGKTVKMQGEYMTQVSEAGITYRFIAVWDATSCCPTSLELELTEGVEYPEEGSEILITGKYTKYTEDRSTFYRIVTDDFEVVAPSSK